MIPAVMLGVLNCSSQQASAELVIVDKDTETIDAKNNLLIDKAPELKGVSIKSSSIDEGRASITVNPETVDFTLLPNQFKQNDEISAKYEKVGTYKNEKVNAEVIFKNIRYVDSKNTNFSDLKITFNKNLYEGFFVSNADDFEINVKFFNQTGEVIDLEEGAFITINSLNKGEFANRLVPNNDLKDYITNDSVVKYKNVSPINREVYVGTGETIPMISETEVPSDSFEDVLGAQTFKRATVSFEVNGTEQNFVIGTADQRIWFTLNSATLFNVVPEKPVKLIQNKNGDDINNETVKAGDLITYKITQKVNTLGMDILEKYKSMQIIDKLPPEVTFEKAELYDEKNQVVDEKGVSDLNNETNTLIYSVNPDYIEKEMAFNGETYILKVDTKVREGIESGTVIKNTAAVSINGKEQATNEVVVSPEEVEVPVEPAPKEPTPQIVKPVIEEKPVELPATGGMDLSMKYRIGVVLSIVSFFSIVGAVIYLIKKRA